MLHSYVVAAALTTSALGSGCIGVSQSQGGAAGGDDAASQAAARAALKKTCPKGVRPAIDGLIDDMEDGNSQLSQLDGREGYWWRSQDDVGSTIEPDKFTPVETEGGNGLCAMYRGKTSSAEGAWGVNFGANFMGSGTYDASKYVGITFRAKVGPDSTTKVRFKIGDVNTHKDAGVCKDCWNHFGQNLVLSTEWAEYQVLFAETRQAPGWGDPNPPALSVDQLWNVDWSIDPGVAFEIYVDDIQFLECKP
jgi:hypothetical protein